MYYGTNEKLKKKIQEFNDNSDWFIFSQGDLEPTYNHVSGSRYSIYSSELRQKLEEIISQRKTSKDNIFSSPAFIDCQLKPNPNEAKNSFGPSNLGWWIIVRKEWIYQQFRKKAGEITIITMLNEEREGNWDICEVGCLGYLFGGINYHSSSEWEEIYQNERGLVRQMWEKFLNICSSTRRTINQRIRNSKLDIAEIFADGEYFNLQPDYCFCGGSPDQQSTYYEDHITCCLNREEKVDEFKKEILKLIERNVEKFKQKQNEVIRKSKQEAENKGVKLANFDFWKKSIYECQNSNQLNDAEKNISNLIQRIFNSEESLRKELENQAREQSKREKERVEREERERENWEKEQEEKRKEQERKRAERNEKEQKSKKRETEENFKSRSKEFETSPEGEELTRKLADLQKKIHELEDSGSNDSYSLKNQREQLEKQLFNSRMKKFTQVSKEFNEPKDNRDNSPEEIIITKFSLNGFYLLFFLIGVGVIIIALIKKVKINI